MATARAMRRHGQNFYTGNDLHRYMLGSGLSDLFCVPLQKVHFVRSVDPRVDAQNFKTAALDAEDRWAQIMNTLPSRSAHHNSQHRTAYNRCRPRAVQVLPIPGQVVPVAVPQVVVRGESGHFVALHAHPAPSPPDSPPAPPYSPLTPEGSPGSCHPPPPPPGSPPPLVLPDHVPLHFSSDDSDDDYSPSTSESESDSDQDSDAPPAGDAADPRVYGYRNWARRVRGIQRDFVHGRLSLDNLHLLDGFNRRNLLMMLSCLFTLNHSDIGFPEEHQFPLIQVLRAHLFGPQHLDAAHADGCRVPLITLFTSPVFDFLHLESVFQEEALATLVPELLPPHPLICFKYHDSLGSSWFNYCAASRVFSWTDRDQVAGRACGCAQHPDLIPDGHEHIICPLASLVSGVPSLRHLTNMGTKYRLPVQDLVVTDQIIEDTVSAILAACNRYASLLTEMSGVLGSMDAWLALANTRVAGHIRDTLHVGMQIRNRHAGLGHTADFFGFTEADLQHPLMQRIHRGFVVTYMDKSPSTFIVYCRKHYLLTVCNDLIPPPPAINPVFQQVLRHPDNILAEDAGFVASLGLKSGTHQLPVYAAIAKLHKTPVASRFLTLSHDTSLTVLAKSVNEFLAAFSPSITKLWDVQMKTANMDSRVILLTPTSTPESWVIHQSPQVISRVQAYNRSMTAEEHHQAPRQVKTFDFQRLYTNLPQADLIHRITGLITQAWNEFHSGAQSFKVFSQKATCRSRFLHSACPVNMRSGVEKGDRFFTWTLATICEAISYLVLHTHVTFGDRVFRQILGIPMGTNPAVHFATLHLFSYELDAVRKCTCLIREPNSTLPYFYTHRSLTAQDLPALLAMQAPQLWERRKDIALFILRQFRFTCRYIDDILALGNAIIDLMLYVDQNFCGFPGIYPRDLLITAGSQSASEPFLDMRLFFLPDGVITTHLYAKLREHKFTGIDTCRFPHITSNLSSRCKYNCLTGEFHRLRRIVLDPENFCYEMARVCVQLELRGYASRRLYKQLVSLCHTHSDMYNKSTGSLLAQVDIYYNIHRHIGLRPYPAPALPLLPEHILPAAAV